MISDDRLKQLSEDHDAAYQEWLKRKQAERDSAIERYHLLNRALAAAGKRGSAQELAEIKAELRKLEQSIHIKSLDWASKHAGGFGHRTNPYDVKWHKQLEAERKKKFGW